MSTSWKQSWWPLLPKEPREDGTTHLKAGRVAYDHSKHWSKQKRGRRTRGLAIIISRRSGWTLHIRFGSRWRGWPRIETSCSKVYPGLKKVEKVEKVGNDVTNHADIVEFD